MYHIPVISPPKLQQVPSSPATSSPQKDGATNPGLGLRLRRGAVGPERHHLGPSLLRRQQQSLAGGLTMRAIGVWIIHSIHCDPKI